MKPENLERAAEIKDELWRLDRCRSHWNREPLEPLALLHTTQAKHGRHTSTLSYYATEADLIELRDKSLKAIAEAEAALQNELETL